MPVPVHLRRGCDPDLDGSRTSSPGAGPPGRAAPSTQGLAGREGHPPASRGSESRGARPPAVSPHDCAAPLPSDGGTPAAVLSFTHGEASTLYGGPCDLQTVQTDELARATRKLGVRRVKLAEHPDSGPDDIPPNRLTAQVTRLIGEERPRDLLVFDTGGVAGHRDHWPATCAALESAYCRRMSATCTTVYSTHAPCGPP
ncbi:PIG-L family deacetylase [Streptomyces sp. NPDC005251]|uniref:PIG-L family deacetylase n=1 Tax=Streptomyces sp. NPDC005251 TaxID=3157166 RepID=UPI0033BAA75E